MKFFACLKISFLLKIFAPIIFVCLNFFLLHQNLKFLFIEIFLVQKKFCFVGIVYESKKFSIKKIIKNEQNFNIQEFFCMLFKIYENNVSLIIISQSCIKIKKAQFLEPSSIFCKFENVPKKN